MAETVEKFFQLVPADRAAVDQIKGRLDDLISVLRGLKLPPPEETPKRRPFRFLYPPELEEAVEAKAQEYECAKVHVVLEAARAYRSRYPLPKDWKDGPHEIENEDKRRIETVLRLTETDRELIRNLGRGRKTVKNRHAAFLALIPIVRRLKLDRPVRQTVRLRLSLRLMTVLEKKKAKTGHSIPTLLLAATHELVQSDHF